MRLDFVQRQKQWEAEQSRQAPQMHFDSPEEEEEGGDEESYDLPTSSGHVMQMSAPSTQQLPMLPEDEVDEVLQREDQELEALLSYMPVDGEGDRHSEHLYSDDDDYDALFSEFMEQDARMEAQGQGQQENVAPSQDGEAMDMS